MSNRFKGVTAAVNRQDTMTELQRQLAELTDRELHMVSDYVKGLRAASLFLSK
jgi:hypothetical protein